MRINSLVEAQSIQEDDKFIIDGSTGTRSVSFGDVKKSIIQEGG